MKKVAILLGVLIMIFGLMSTANADLSLYLDTTPNDGTRPAFFDATYAAIFNGTMVNQAHSYSATNAGTYKYEAEDYLVYSFADNGKRLHAYYWLPGETTTTLAAKNFQVAIFYQDKGVWESAYKPWYKTDWVTPKSWINYDGDSDGTTDGVMGSMGNALWGAYYPIHYTTDTPEARAALALDLQYVKDYIGDTRFMVRFDGNEYELRALHTAAVPIPGALVLLGAGLVRLARYGRRKKALI